MSVSSAALLLASASPRRRELLALIGLPFESRAAGIDETPRPDEAAVDYVQRLAREKAEQISKPTFQTATGEGRRVVVAADTEVVIDGEILGKPKDAADAAQMLRRLRGRTHEVVSAVAALDARSGALREEVCRSSVPMRAYSDDEIAAYVADGDPMDKAGAYAIQHDGFHPVENFSHCFASVMGLPLCHLTRALRQFGLAPPADVPAACQRFNRYFCPVYSEIL
ncbi:MAG: septum formation protein Maf [Chloroflexi bacterium]|nr:septum formation protein Maf [Chloroflexota bacterium]